MLITPPVVFRGVREWGSGVTDIIGERHFPYVHHQKLLEHRLVRESPIPQLEHAIYPPTRPAGPIYLRFSPRPSTSTMRQVCVQNRDPPSESRPVG